MVQILNHLPLSPQTLIDYKLGRAIKVLKEKCKSNDKEELLSQTIQLMNKWSDQHNHQRSARSDPNTESIRDSESPPSFPPSIVPLGSSVAEKRKSPRKYPLVQ
ncbi:hypothetical protein BDB00DRAFT_333575 [Zychaea mexicana]|uniref:uncharacterized protein n=1 Tax=Zychaea mexicana TaxID=64656 RepID=UPI0022FE8AD4|nr:uncharacterized protein BDB00DRAFT_333575 [Zychaea mexicana]KAI9499086.1 hypothetical protein BDB00DRAFT_333575 [Zychaea mexicana]